MAKTLFALVLASFSLRLFAAEEQRFCGTVQTTITRSGAPLFVLDLTIPPGTRHARSIPLNADVVADLPNAGESKAVCLIGHVYHHGRAGGRVYTQIFTYRVEEQ